MLLKVNENYNGDYISLQSGKIFFKKNNNLNKDESIHDIDLIKNPEAKSLFEQKLLVESIALKEDTKFKNKGMNSSMMN